MSRCLGGEGEEGGEGGEGEEEGEDINVEYGALSVAVLTIGLILVVEVIRHRIDHAANGRVFAQAVLAAMYSERK